VFKTTVDGRKLTFARRAGARPLRLFDAETASEWDFAGTALSGPLAGRRLEKVFALKEYWFDWKAYNPATGIWATAASSVPPATPSPARAPAKDASAAAEPANAAPSQN
jgi:hypothetical protein